MHGQPGARGPQAYALGSTAPGVRPPAERRLGGYRIAQTWIDWALIVASWATSMLLAEGLLGLHAWRHQLGWIGDWIVHGIAWTIALSTAEMYDPRRWRWPLATVGRTLASVAVATVIAFGALELITNIPDHVRQELMAGALLFALLASLSRLISFRMIPAEVIARRFLLVGVSEGAEAFREELDRFGDPILHHAGIAPLPDDPEPSERLGPVADIAELEAEAVGHDVTDIVFCAHTALPDNVARRSMACAAAGMRLHPVAAAYSDLFHKALLVGIREDEWLAGVRWVERSRYATRVKRMLDLAFGGALFLLTLPVLIVAAIAVALDSPGGPLFMQERVGYRGKVFRLLKLRSMTVLTDEARARGEQQRTTRIGRFLRPSRIDELPQLLHVLAGDMSLIGPRPEQPHLVERYTDEVPLFAQRHFVRPGITGWAQVKQDYAQSIDDVPGKVAYDLYYISNLSIRLDMLVLLKTVEVVVAGRGDHGQRKAPSA